MGNLKESDIHNLEHERTPAAKRVLLVDESGDAIDNTNPIHINQTAIVSANNSTTTPLGIDGVFTGIADDMLHYASATIHIFTDEASATDGLSIQWSSDAMNWDHSEEYTVPASAAGKGFFTQAMKEGRYLRIVYTNGGTAQTVFRMQILCSPIPSVSEVQPLDLAVKDENDALLVRSVLAAQKPDTTYTNINATAGGNLKVSIEEADTSASGLAKAEDAVHSSGDVGVMALGVRNDFLASLVDADGDYAPLQVNAKGALYTKSEVFEAGTVDTFGHLITGEISNQIEIQFFRDTPANLLTVTVTNGGSTSQVGGSGQFETSTNADGSAKGVTALTTSYRSGSEIFTVFTALFTTPTDAGSYQRIGLYGDNDGIFFGFEGTSFGVTIRNGGSDTTVAKGSFSEDTLTGATGSKFTRAGVPEAIDLTKLNVYRIRYGWLGSAPVNFEVLSPDDVWVPVHIIKQPNLATIASLENPDLPMTIDVNKTSSDATNLIMLTNCWGAGTTTSAVPIDETITDDTLSKVTRTIIAGKKPNGDYVNIETTAGGNLKTSLQEISDGLDIGAGNAGAETARVSISTDDVNLSAIKTAIEGVLSVASEKTSSSTTSGKVSVGNTSTSILASNASRKAAIIVNDSDETIYLNLSATAVLNEGIRINANGGSHREEMYTGAITGISASGSKNVTVTEL